MGKVITIDLEYVLWLLGFIASAWGVVKIIKDSIQASIDYGTDEVTFTLPFKSDKDLVVSYLAIFKYTATFESNPDGSILFKFLIKLPE